MSFKVQVDYRNAKGRRLPFSVRGKIRKADPYIDCLGRQPVAAIELVMIFAGAGKVVLEPLFEVASVAFPYVGKDARTFRSPANVLGSSEANLT